jgi:hypothetical protein
MKRRTSGQVLIGAATLMLVILLTMAASLPVINTSIDPSSKVYNLALYAVRSAVDDLITRMSAYQCATALWYADARHKKIDFTGQAKEIENRIKYSLTQTASKSSYNLELQSISVAIRVAKIVISSTVWDGNPKSASAGKVEISMWIHVYVSFEYRIKNSGQNFQKYTAQYEEYLTIKGEGEVKKKVPWQGLPWVELTLSFVPIVGAFVGNIEGVTFKLPTRVTHYKAVFNNQRVFAGVESDDLTNSLALVMLKPRDKIEFYSETKNKKSYKTIEWVEYNKIDWGAIAVGVAIDLIPWGKVLKATKAVVKQDIVNDGAETLYFSTNQIKWARDIAQQIYKRTTNEELEKVSKTNTNTNTNSYFGQPKGGQGGRGGQADESTFAQIFQNKVSNEIKDVMNYNAGAAVSGTIKQESKAQGSAFDNYLRALDTFYKSIGLGPPPSRSQTTKSEGNELYQSTTSGGKLADYIVNNNPIVWIGLPLHNGNSLFGVCVWLIGAYYPGDA